VVDEALLKGDVSSDFCHQMSARANVMLLNFCLNNNWKNSHISNDIKTIKKVPKD
jgi:hypothetical protein